MFSFWANRKKEKCVKILLDNLLASLKEKFPELYENHQHWKFQSIINHPNSDNSFQIQYLTTDNLYFEKNRKKHNKSFIINGLQIAKKSKPDFINFKLTIINNLILLIYLPYPNFHQEFDVNRISIENISIETFEINNPESDKLKRILKNIPKDKTINLEIEDTIEIELNNKFYYTILDMEDGNYIALDKNRKVYRLLHDSSKPEKMIYKDISDFLNNFDGNKISLLKHFED